MKRGRRERKEAEGKDEGERMNRKKKLKWKTMRKTDEEGKGKISEADTVRLVEGSKVKNYTYRLP